MELCLTRWDVPLPKTLFLTSEIDAPLKGIHIIIVFLKNPYPYPNQGVNTMDTLWRRRIHIWINPSFVSIMFFAFHVCLPLVFTSAAFSIICIQKRLKTLLESIFLKQNVMISESSRFGNFFAFLLPRRDFFFRQKCFFAQKIERCVARWDLLPSGALSLRQRQRCDVVRK